MSNQIKINLLRVVTSHIIHMEDTWQTRRYDLIPVSLCGIEFWRQEDYEEEIVVDPGNYENVTCINCQKVLRARGLLPGVRPIRDTQASVENRLDNLGKRIAADRKKHEEDFVRLSRGCRHRQEKFRDVYYCFEGKSQQHCGMYDCPFV